MAGQGLCGQDTAAVYRGEPEETRAGMVGPVACSLVFLGRGEDRRVVVLGKDMTTEMVGQGVGFERTRRITGYLVGTLDRFNDAKRAEERDRIKHGA